MNKGGMTVLTYIYTYIHTYVYIPVVAGRQDISRDMPVASLNS